MLPLSNGISWESHLLGAIAGIITAYNFRKEGPQARKYDFGDDEENEKMDVSGEQLFDYTDIGEPDPNEVQPIYNFIPAPKDTPKD